MNAEIKGILSNDNIHIIECDKNWCNAYGYEKSQLKEDLLDYITNLQQENEHFRTQVNTYENPDDYTLFYMWLDAKAKDKMKQLQEENERLKENAIHNDKVVDNAKWNEMIYKSRCVKAIEYITNNKLYTFKYDDEELFEITTDKKAKDDLLKILGGDEE